MNNLCTVSDVLMSYLKEIVMNAKMIVALLLFIAAVPGSYAEHFGRGSDNSPFAGKPGVSAAATVAQPGRASNYGVATAPKSEIKARVATIDTPGRA